MTKIHDIVRLSGTLFPPGDSAEEQWNNRVVRVVALVLPEIVEDDCVWRVEPHHQSDENDYIHVHSYEMSHAFDTHVSTMETDEK